MCIDMLQSVCDMLASRGVVIVNKPVNYNEKKCSILVDALLRIHECAQHVRSVKFTENGVSVTPRGFGDFAKVMYNPFNNIVHIVFDVPPLLHLGKPGVYQEATVPPLNVDVKKLLEKASRLEATVEEYVVLAYSVNPQLVRFFTRCLGIDIEALQRLLNCLSSFFKNCRVSLTPFMFNINGMKLWTVRVAESGSRLLIVGEHCGGDVVKILLDRYITVTRVGEYIHVFALLDVEKFYAYIMDLEHPPTDTYMYIRYRLRNNGLELVYMVGNTYMYIEEPWAVQLLIEEVLQQPNE